MYSSVCNTITELYLDIDLSGEKNRVNLIDNSYTTDTTIKSNVLNQRTDISKRHMFSNSVNTKTK